MYTICGIPQDRLGEELPRLFCLLAESFEAQLGNEARRLTESKDLNEALFRSQAGTENAAWALTLVKGYRPDWIEITHDQAIHIDNHLTLTPADDDFQNLQNAILRMADWYELPASTLYEGDAHDARLTTIVDCTNMW
jgi:hypothetical protein